MKKIKSVRTEARCDKKKTEKAFSEKNPRREPMTIACSKNPDAETERKKQKRDQISQRVQSGTFFRVQVFRTRDFAIAAIENAMKVEKPRPNNKSPIMAACQEEKADHRKKRDQPSPNIRSDRRLEKETTDRARNWSIQIARNNSIPRFSAAAKQPALATCNLTVAGKIAPGSAVFRGARIETSSFKSLPKFFPERRLIANRRIVLERN